MKSRDGCPGDAVLLQLRSAGAAPNGRNRPRWSPSNREARAVYGISSQIQAFCKRLFVEVNFGEFEVDSKGEDAPLGQLQWQLPGY